MSQPRIVQVVMPQMGESLAEGTIVKWLKQPGDRIGHDEPLFELSTDKVDTDVPAPAAGILASILANAGDTVAVGTPVALIETAEAAAGAEKTPTSVPAAATSVRATSVPAGSTSVPPTSVPPATSVPVGATSVPVAARAEEPAGHFKSTHAPQLVSFRRESRPETSVAATSVPATSVPTRPTSVPARTSVPATSVPGRATSVPADRGTSVGPSNRSFSPAVLGHAQRGGLSLGQLTALTGSGRGGRITKRDIQRFLDSGGSQDSSLATQHARAARTSAGPPPEFIYRPVDGDRVEAMSPVRKRIARHMRWSTRISAHASAQGEVDMSAVSGVMARREAFAAQFGVPLTYTVFAALASVRALREFPVLNSSVVGDQIVFKPAVNLGIAVALADTNELIVPVVRRADELSLAGLARAVHDIATRARARQLRPEDVQGGTFTLTNPGIFGGITGTPILNQPQVAILSLGAIRKQPVVVDDEVVVRAMMTLTLTFDHRATDGMVAFRFLARVRELLEALPADWNWT